MSATTLRLSDELKSRVSRAAERAGTMTQIEFAPDAADDIDRIVDPLIQHDIPNTATRSRDLMRAIDTLDRNPLIGRAVEREIPERVIGRHDHGCIAPSANAPESDIIFALALRSQSEAEEPLR